jgi:hypothetical protein
MTNIYSSAGYVSGFGITDNADGTVDVLQGVIYIKKTNSDTGEIIRDVTAGDLGIAITVGKTEYLYIDYNTTNPVIDKTDDPSIFRHNGNTFFELYEITRGN